MLCIICVAWGPNVINLSENHKGEIFINLLCESLIIYIKVWSEPWKRYKVLLQAWIEFWRDEPLNNGVRRPYHKLGDKGKELLELMLYDMLNSDHETPTVVAMDTAENKVC